MIARAKKALWLFLLMSNFCLGIVIVVILWRWSQPPEPVGMLAVLRAISQQPPPAPAIEYKDFVSILLTALGLMIGVGALFFAFVAIIGYQEGIKLIERLVTKRLDEIVQPKAARALLEASQSVLPSDEANEIAASVDDDNARD